jgi:drug/metabolite transporter (DMT)-like permease
VLFGILAALLFGVSAPLSKLLLEGIDPIILAGLLYLGAGAATGGLLVLGRMIRVEGTEARIERRDIPWLAGATLTGGVLGPILLLLGLRLTHAAAASLLLNLEVVATGLMASLLFRESVGRRAWSAIIAVTIGGALLSIDLSRGLGISTGALLIVGACLAWGFDNNLIGRISLKDPKRIVMIKGLAAGAFSLLLGILLGNPLPSLSRTLYALALGAISYGASISFFVLSLRRVGAARASVLFGLAPFMGVAVSLVVFRQLPAWPFFAALVLMVLATALLVRERHEHWHMHTSMIHTHPHRHDDGHHEHEHTEDRDGNGPHVHAHAHGELAHSHEHRPDPHHRHVHGEEGPSSQRSAQQMRPALPQIPDHRASDRAKVCVCCTVCSIWTEG